MTETTMFWHVECAGISIDYATTGDHRPDLPDIVEIDCPICGGEHGAARCTEQEHEAYKADCTEAAGCPAYYHEHGCPADADCTSCRRPCPQIPDAHEHETDDGVHVIPDECTDTCSHPGP